MNHLLRVLCMIAACSILVAAIPDTSYRDRGNRHEGKLRRPINSFDVQLLGAFAEGTHSSGADTHETTSLIFFPESVEGGVSITLQERFPKHHYRLDHVVATQPWRAKTVNTFTWPTKDVLRPLGLHAGDLLPLVRIGRPDGGAARHVAPARWRGTSETQIDRYRFVFTVGARAKTRHRLHTPTAGQAIPSAYETRSPRKPFDVIWVAKEQPEGSYRLQLEGRYLDDGVKFTRTIRFFHSPRW